MSVAVGAQEVLWGEHLGWVPDVHAGDIFRISGQRMRVDTIRATLGQADGLGSVQHMHGYIGTLPPPRLPRIRYLFCPLQSE